MTVDAQFCCIPSGQSRRQAANRPGRQGLEQGLKSAQDRPAML